MQNEIYTGLWQGPLICHLTHCLTSPRRTKYDFLYFSSARTFFFFFNQSVTSHSLEIPRGSQSHASWWERRWWALVSSRRVRLYGNPLEPRPASLAVRGAHPVIGLAQHWELRELPLTSVEPPREAWCRAGGQENPHEHKNSNSTMGIALFAFRF